MFLIIMKNFNIYLQILNLKKIKIKIKDCSNFKGLSNLNKLNVNTNTSKLYWIIICENF